MFSHVLSTFSKNISHFVKICRHELEKNGNDRKNVKNFEKFIGTFVVDMISALTIFGRIHFYIIDKNDVHIQCLFKNGKKYLDKKELIKMIGSYLLNMKNLEIYHILEQFDETDHQFDKIFNTIYYESKTKATNALHNIYYVFSKTFWDIFENNYRHTICPKIDCNQQLKCNFDKNMLLYSIGLMVYMMLGIKIIPNKRSLNIIKKYSKNLSVLTIGDKSGIWAHMLSKNMINVRATFGTDTSTALAVNNREWFSVEALSPLESIQKYNPDVLLAVCSDNVLIQCINNYKFKYVIIIGELGDGATDSYTKNYGDEGMINYDENRYEWIEDDLYFMDGPNDLHMSVSVYKLNEK